VKERIMVLSRLRFPRSDILCITEDRSSQTSIHRSPPDASSLLDLLSDVGLSGVQTCKIDAVILLSQLDDGPGSASDAALRAYKPVYMHSDSYNVNINFLFATTIRAVQLSESVEPYSNDDNNCPTSREAMSHYIPTKLVLPAGTAPLICALPECQITVSPLPAPPPFSLLKATSAMLNPTAKDVRIFFCSGEHRDKYWQSEQGWLDRRVAMPSVCFKRRSSDCLSFEIRLTLM
jgi:hypothetical protein